MSGWLASEYAARDVLVAGGAVVALVALLVSVLFVRDTGEHAALEQASAAHPEEGSPSLRRAFADATYGDPALRSCSQAGFTNNLNDALAWGLVPLFLAAHGASASEIGLVAGLYPAVWGAAQIWTGHRSDRVGRKPLIVAGMLVQAAALALLAASGGAVVAAAIAAVVLGVGTALVYPTLIAAISDAVSPVARPPAVGTSLLARHGVRGRRADRGNRGRRDRLQRGDRPGGGAHRRLGAMGRSTCRPGGRQPTQSRRSLHRTTRFRPSAALASQPGEAQQQNAPRTELAEGVQVSEAGPVLDDLPSSMRLITMPQILIARPPLWPSATQRETTRSPSLTWSSTLLRRSPSLKTSW